MIQTKAEERKQKVFLNNYVKVFLFLRDRCAADVKNSPTSSGPIMEQLPIKLDRLLFS